VAARLVVLVSGTGTNLQALLDAAADPGYGAQVAAVGADRAGIEGLARAERAGVPTFVHRLRDFPGRESWDESLTSRVAAYEPDLIVSAGFLKLVGKAFLDRFSGRFINSHPALLPSFPGMYGPRDALAYGVQITGVTIFMVDAGVDSGPIVAQAAVPVEPGDDEHGFGNLVGMLDMVDFRAKYLSEIIRGIDGTADAVGITFGQFECGVIATMLAHYRHMTGVKIRARGNPIQQGAIRWLRVTGRRGRLAGHWPVINGRIEESDAKLI